MSKHVIKPFRWRDRKGNFHYVTDMDSRHLFYTVRMIWNHSAPENVKLKPYKKYNFSKFYSNKYMANAIRCMTKELSLRDDLNEIWVNELLHMYNHIHNIKGIEHDKNNNN